MTPEESRARRRFIALNLIRLSGLAMVLLALAIHGGKIPAPVEAAWPLAIIGLFGFFFVPALLARHWKAPDL